MIKKILAGFILLAGSFHAISQSKFQPGVRAGVNFSHFTKGNYNNVYYDNYYGGEPSFALTRPNYYNYKSKTDFYIGVFGAINFTKFYTLQPELDYSRQGSKLELYSTVRNERTKKVINISYLSLTFINKFKFNNFNIHAGPTLDFIVDKSPFGRYQYSQDYFYSDAYTNADVGVQLGVGYDFTKNFGIEARVKKGFIPVIFIEDDRSNVNFSVGATYTFDLKTTK